MVLEAGERGRWIGKLDDSLMVREQEEAVDVGLLMRKGRLLKPPESMEVAVVLLEDSPSLLVRDRRRSNLEEEQEEEQRPRLEASKLEVGRDLRRLKLLEGRVGLSLVVER